MSIFKKIGHWFEGLFDAAKKAYNEQPQEVKDSFTYGVGFAEILKTSLGQGPATIREMAIKKYPKLDLQKMESILQQMLQFFNIKYTTIDDGIEALQTHISSMDGKAWAIAEHTLGSLFSVLYAPPETKVKTVVSLIEWFYQKFFKKSVD